MERLFSQVVLRRSILGEGANGDSIAGERDRFSLAKLLHDLAVLHPFAAMVRATILDAPSHVALMLRTSEQTPGESLVRAPRIGEQALRQPLLPEGFVHRRTNRVLQPGHLQVLGDQVIGPPRLNNVRGGLTRNANDIEQLREEAQGDESRRQRLLHSELLQLVHPVLEDLAMLARNDLPEFTA